MKLRNLSELNIDNLIDIVIIEDICLPLYSWEFPHFIYFSNMMFIDSFVLEFHQKKKNENYYSEPIVFCYYFKSFYFYWHFKNTPELKEIKNISMETINYLIGKKYDLPKF